MMVIIDSSYSLISQIFERADPPIARIHTYTQVSIYLYNSSPPFDILRNPSTFSFKHQNLFYSTRDCQNVLLWCPPVVVTTIAPLASRHLQTLLIGLQVPDQFKPRIHLSENISLAELLDSKTQVSQSRLNLEKQHLAVILQNKWKQRSLWRSNFHQMQTFKSRLKTWLLSCTLCTFYFNFSRLLLVFNIIVLQHFIMTLAHPFKTLILFYIFF